MKKLQLKLNKVLEGENLKDNIVKMIEKIIDEAIHLYTSGTEYPEEWKLDLLESYLHSIFLPKNIIDKNNYDLTREDLKESIYNKAMEIYNEKEESFTSERMRELERFILLRVVDTKWIDHGADSVTNTNASRSNDKQSTFVRNDKKIRRNDPCPCGSGKKYKNCCGVGKVD